MKPIKRYLFVMQPINGVLIICRQQIHYLFILTAHTEINYTSYSLSYICRVSAHNQTFKRIMAGHKQTQTDTNRHKQTLSHTVHNQVERKLYSNI